MALAAARSAPWLTLLVALVMTLCNAWEAPTVDDVCHHYYARQVAEDPLHPLSFSIDWHQRPVAAFDVMVPPVYSYCWAPAIAWFGDDPVAWRFWFLPMHWLFCASLLGLLRRYARRHANALLVLLALGPSVLPGINNMLEVPMLTIGLTALELFHRAVERRSGVLALVAGAVLGLAFQTKYSAFAFVGPFALLALLQRRPRELLLAAVGTAVVAGGIEWLLAVSHNGASYFQNRLAQVGARDWVHIVLGMVLQYGGLGLPLTLVGLYALRAPRWLGVVATSIFVGGFLLVGLVPDTAERSFTSSLDTVAYLAMAACTWGVTAILFWRIGWPVLRRVTLPQPRSTGAVRLLLLGWFLAEIATSLLISPFPAARRVLGMLIAASFAAGWLAAQRRPTTLPVWRYGAVSVLFGVAFQGIDLLEGRAFVQAAAEAYHYTQATDPAAKAYFTGGWGFEFCAPRAGLAPLLEGHTTLQRGDFVVCGSIDGIETPWFLDDPRLPAVHEIGIDDGVPWSLLFQYYSGRRPLDGQVGPRFVARILRATTTIEKGSLKLRQNTATAVMTPRR